MDNRSNNKRIAKNTLMLYVRMVFVLLVNLYISRIVLQALGVDDFGLYSVVGSIVAFLGFLNTSMAAASQRFLSYEKGRGDENKLNSTFNSIVRVQIIIGVIIFILCETLGVFYISNYLKVDPSKLTAAHMVFQFSIATILVNTITVPYNASIISNERLDIFAVFSIMDVLLKLGIAFSLRLFHDNTVIYYAGFMFACMFIIQGLYRWYCRRHFKECKLQKNSNITTIKEILSYSGWNLFGSFSGVAMNQGVNMVLNSFFGVVVNAARGISFQVSAALTQLYTNFQQALTPQIVKAYAAGDMNRMHFLITQGTRLAFFLLYVFAIPIIFNMNGVLKLWLGEVPEYTTVFCILVIIDSMVASMSQSLMHGVMATTNIKKYQIIVASITMLNLPLSIIVLKIYPNPYLTVYVMMALTIISFIARLLLAHSIIGLSVTTYLKKAILPILISVVISTPLTLLINWFLPTNDGLGRLFLRLAIALIVCVCIVAIFGITKGERKMAFDYVNNKIMKKNETCN